MKRTSITNVEILTCTIQQRIPKQPWLEQHLMLRRALCHKWSLQDLPIPRHECSEVHSWRHRDHATCSIHKPARINMFSSFRRKDIHDNYSIQKSLTFKNYIRNEDFCNTVVIKIRQNAFCSVKFTTFDPKAVITLLLPRDGVQTCVFYDCTKVSLSV